MIKYLLSRRPITMAREKKIIHKVQMTDGKKLLSTNFFRSMISSQLKTFKMHSKTFSEEPSRK
jgi:hypothetical protein